MPAPSRKRRRPSIHGSDRPGKRTPSKSKEPQEDEEIFSDDAASDPGSPTAQPAELVEASDSEDENETAEQKRLRLARAYLRHMGISEDASDPDDDGDSDESEGDDPNSLLRKDALVQTGRATVELADRFAAAVKPLSSGARDATGTSGGSATMRRCAKGHALSPTAVALSGEDSSTAVSGGKDSRLIVWDVETGARKFTFKPDLGTDDGKAKKPTPERAGGHLGPILSVAISDDGALAVSGGRDGLVRVWDVRAGKLVKSMRGHRGPVGGLAFRAGTRQMFSACADRTVKVWDMEDMGYVETLFGHGGEVSAVDSLASERAISAGRDGTLRLYKIVQGSQLVFRRAETMSIDAVSMITESRFLSGGDDGALCLWQMNKKKPVAVAENAHGGGDGCIRLWRSEQVPKLVNIGKIDLGPGFINGIAIGQKNNVVVAAVGKEHRLGRWSRIQGGRNAIHFVKLPNLD